MHCSSAHRRRNPVGRMVKSYTYFVIGNYFPSYTFYRVSMLCMQSAILFLPIPSVCLSIRPSVRLSNTDIVSELKDISSQFFSRYSRDAIRFCAPPPLQNSNANLRVDNCCACLVFCQLISVSFCVTFTLFYVLSYFVIKFIKYDECSFPSLGRM